jgi:hypothetical protein
LVDADADESERKIGLNAMAPMRLFSTACMAFAARKQVTIIYIVMVVGSTAAGSDGLGLAMLTPDPRHYCRFQADFPLLDCPN